MTYTTVRAFLFAVLAACASSLAVADDLVGLERLGCASP